jgi:hypothetical protein
VLIEIQTLERLWYLVKQFYNCRQWTLSVNLGSVINSIVCQKIWNDQHLKGSQFCTLINPTITVFVLYWEQPVAGLRGITGRMPPTATFCFYSTTATEPSHEHHTATTGNARMLLLLRTVRKTHKQCFKFEIIRILSFNDRPVVRGISARLYCSVWLFSVATCLGSADVLYLTSDVLHSCPKRFNKIGTRVEISLLTLSVRTYLGPIALPGTKVN